MTKGLSLKYPLSDKLLFRAALVYIRMCTFPRREHSALRTSTVAAVVQFQCSSSAVKSGRAKRKRKRKTKEKVRTPFQCSPVEQRKVIFGLLSTATSTTHYSEERKTENLVGTVVTIIFC